MCINFHARVGPHEDPVPDTPPAGDRDAVPPPPAVPRIGGTSVGGTSVGGTDDERRASVELTAAGSFAGAREPR